MCSILGCTNAVTWVLPSGLVHLGLLVWVLEHGYLVAGACVEIILVHAQFVNTRIKADALHDALYDGLVIDVACCFSAGASSASASHPLDFVLQCCASPASCALVDHTCRTMRDGIADCQGTYRSLLRVGLSPGGAAL